MLPVRNATVLAAGTIGLGWMVLFLGAGLRVTVHSSRGEVSDQLRTALELFAPGLPATMNGPAAMNGRSTAELGERLLVEPDLERAVAEADVVQENAPEQLELKQQLFERVERAAGPDTLLLSSTSTLVPDRIGARMRQPERVLVGHPFNPPHVIPLVEVVPGEATPEQTVGRALDFYRQVGRHPVLLRKPIMGFVANRLQTALLRESIHLVREGVVTVEQLDEVVTHSIGLRWATTGPFLAAHLAGGPGGLAAWLGHIGAGLERGWAALGEPSMDSETRRRLLDQVDAAFGDRSYDHLTTRRDRAQNAVLAALANLSGPETEPATGPDARPGSG